MASEALDFMGGVETAHDFLVRCFIEAPEVRNLALTTDPARKISRTECDLALGVTGGAGMEFKAVKDAIYILRAQAEEQRSV